MKLQMQTITVQVAMLAMLLSQSTDAFSTMPATRVTSSFGKVQPQLFLRQQPSSSSSSSSKLFGTSQEADNEIERLRTMAANLRAEAAALESEQQKVVANAALKAFNKFDTNKDGNISSTELKAGLEKTFKMELSDKRVKQLMDAFDKSGDGSLTLNDFVAPEVMRNRLDALAREEKALSLEKDKSAKMEAEAVQLMQAQLELINDKKPSNTDKLVSCLPYLFPLLDGLQFAGALVTQNMENPVAVVTAIVYSLYRAVPFGGLIAFFALSFLSNNPSINRLVRYNMQQAIYLDIALFFPGLIAALIGVISPTAIPPALSELGNDFLFFSMFAAVIYSVISSLLGQEPNKIPVISSAVESRMPTVEMFDSSGRFIPKEERKPKDDDEKKNDKK